MRSNRHPLHLTALLLGLCILGTSCSVKIRDRMICGDKGDSGAYCVWMLNEKKELYMDKPTWDTERFGMACMTAPDLSDLIGIIEKLCFDGGRCTYEEAQKLKRLAIRITGSK